MRYHSTANHPQSHPVTRPVQVSVREKYLLDWILCCFVSTTESLPSSTRTKTIIDTNLPRKGKRNTPAVIYLKMAIRNAASHSLSHDRMKKKQTADTRYTGKKDIQREGTTTDYVESVPVTATVMGSGGGARAPILSMAVALMLVFGASIVISIIPLSLGTASNPLSNYFSLPLFFNLQPSLPFPNSVIIRFRQSRPPMFSPLRSGRILPSCCSTEAGCAGDQPLGLLFFGREYRIRDRLGFMWSRRFRYSSREQGRN